MVQITRFLVGACFLILNGATALDWSVTSVADTASRDNPQTGVFYQEALASAKSNDVARLLTIQSSQDVQLPLPDGTLHTFRIHPSSIMSPELAAKHRNIRAFEGESALSTLIHSQSGLLKHEKISVVLSVSQTAAGGTELHAQYVSNKRGYMHLEPSQAGSSQNSDLSFRVSSRDTAKATSDFECHTEDEANRKLMEDALVSSHMDLIQDNRRKLQENGCNVETLGNFQCDPNNNREECNFDAGDCCGGFKERVAECTPNDDPTSCLCKDVNYLTVTPRTLRVAVAANVEFSAYYNSNRDAVMAQIVHTFTRVAGLFRREVGIGLEIVHTHIETDPDTRVLGHSDTWSVAQQLPAVFDEAIGNDAYDIGHCLIGAAGGVAGDIGVACNPETKAMGVTGRGKFEGDLSEFVDVVVHEMGHQMGSHHMFSGCGGNSGTPGFRVEPGGGTTFMSYAGICGFDDIQKSPSPYFHTLSLESIRRYMSNPAGGASCGFIETEEQSIDRPNVEAQISLLNPTVRRCAIPPSTPFRLSAVGAPITDGYYYSWEQVDNTEEPDSNGLDDTPPADGALFRSIPPKQNDASRVFPSLDLILGRVSEAYHERLPPTPREMEFVLGVRKEYIARDVIDTTSFYLTDYSAFYVGDSVKVTVADVAPLQVSSVIVADNQPDDDSQITFEVTWAGGNLANTVRVVAADGTVQSPDFAILLGSGINNNGKAEITTSRLDICTTAPGGQAVLYVKVESDAYLDGCSYFAIAPSTVAVDCSDVTPPPTVPPTPENLIDVEFEYGPQDGNFTENGKEPSAHYENNRRYKYLITGEPGKKILLEFTELDVESDYDFLNVYDGETDEAPLLMRHTGQGNGRTVLSTGDKLFMTLITDPIVAAQGFVVYHTSVDETVTQAPTSSTPPPSTVATTAPTEDQEYIDVGAVEGSKSFNVSVNVKTTIVITPSLPASTMNLKFATPTFGFYGTLESMGQDQATSESVEPDKNSFEMNVFRGHFRITIDSVNEFPVETIFTVTETKIDVPTFGTVKKFHPISRDGSQVISAPFRETPDEAAPKYSRGVASFLNLPVWFYPRQLESNTLCFLASGDATRDEYSYTDNVLYIVTETSLPAETTANFLNDFPEDLGDVSNVPVLIRSFGDFGLHGILIHEQDVTIMCGQVQGGFQSSDFTFALDPLLTTAPFTTSGTITAQDSEVIQYFFNEAPGLISAVMIQSTNDEPITFQITNPPEGKFATHVLGTSLTPALLGTHIEVLYTFGGSSGSPYPVEPVTIGGVQNVTIAFGEAGIANPTSVPEVFEISYSVGGTGNFTQPLPGDNIGDQVNMVQIDTSNPTYFKSGNQPFGTKEHALNERWEFVAPEGYKLKITFSVLDVEESADFVHLYAGTQVGNANRVQSFTGSYVPAAITIENNAMVLRVVRDSSDDRVYRGVQGVVEVVREDNQWYLYVIGTMGVVTVGAVALLVKKSRSTSVTAEYEEEAMAASAIEFMEGHKHKSDGNALLTANPLFDANNI